MEWMRIRKPADEKPNNCKFNRTCTWTWQRLTFLGVLVSSFSILVMRRMARLSSYATFSRAMYRILSGSDSFLYCKSRIGLTSRLTRLSHKMNPALIYMKDTVCLGLLPFGWKICKCFAAYGNLLLNCEQSCATSYESAHTSTPL